MTECKQEVGESMSKSMNIPEFQEWVSDEGDGEIRMERCEGCDHDYNVWQIEDGFCGNCRKEKTMDKTINEDPVAYDDEIGEWVATSQFSGREYFGQTSDQARANMDEDDTHFLRKRVEDQLALAKREEFICVLEDEKD